MYEKYCPSCRLIHRESFEFCCECDGELVERLESSNGKDKTCPICIDRVELA